MFSEQPNKKYIHIRQYMGVNISTILGYLRETSKRKKLDKFLLYLLSKIQRFGSVFDVASAKFELFIS